MQTALPDVAWPTCIGYGGRSLGYLFVLHFGLSPNYVGYDDADPLRPISAILA